MADAAIIDEPSLKAMINVDTVIGVVTLVDIR
jgi:hypothetical protein